MNAITFKRTTQFGAYTTLFGSVCMLTGAALLMLSGADMDVALQTGEIGKYLAALEQNRVLLILNLSLWILGVLLIGLAATLMISLNPEKRVLARIAHYNFQVAIPLVVVSYMAWMAVIVPISQGTSSEVAYLTESMGWFATRADWVATILILGVGPVLLAQMGKGVWAPRWLVIWSYAALFTGLLTGIGLFAGGMTSYGFLIIPVGMGWMLGAGVVLLRRGG